MSSVPAYSPFLWLSEKTVMTPSAPDSSSASAPVPVYLPVIQEASLTADEAISKAEKHEKVTCLLEIGNIENLMVGFLLSYSSRTRSWSSTGCLP